MRLRRVLGLWTAFLVLGAACGCSRRDPTDVQEVASALRRAGVRYDVTETAALGSIGAEGLRLRGPGLEVELYAIEDEDDVERALTAAALMAAAERSAGVGGPTKAYARGDLFVLVRAEPVEGGVAAALKRIPAE